MKVLYSCQLADLGGLGMAPPCSSNQLSIPFRKSTQISFSSAITQYISKKYDQHPDMFRHDLEVIDSLRRDAVNVREAHPSGIKKLEAYASQLAWIGGKFPIDVSNLPLWHLDLIRTLCDGHSDGLGC